MRKEQQTQNLTFYEFNTFSTADYVYVSFGFWKLQSALEKYNPPLSHIHTHALIETLNLQT